MEREERRWLGFLVVVALVVNVLTLSQLVPWQAWQLWSPPDIDREVAVVMQADRIYGLDKGIELQAGEFVAFTATSLDVTHGFGVFRQDGTMVFQMQVVPGHENRIVWTFDQAGAYDVRSTEYAGSRQSNLLYRAAILVNP
jgi:cytochrome c oxidase subunit 2